MVAQDMSTEEWKPSLWLLIARYNHENWKALEAKNKGWAMKNARRVFGYKSPDKVTTFPPEVDVTFRVIDSFKNLIHPWVKQIYEQTKQDYPDLQGEALEAKVDEVIDRELPAKLAGLPAEQKNIGWMVVVDDTNRLKLESELKDEKNGGQGNIWGIFACEWIPLNDDADTTETYEYMTIRSWY